MGIQSVNEAFKNKVIIPARAELWDQFKKESGWFIFRPPHRSFLVRLKDAWLVLCGDAEAVIFAEPMISKPKD